VPAQRAEILTLIDITTYPFLIVQRVIANANGHCCRGGGFSHFHSPDPLALTRSLG
jgi:hypothetical protein